MDYVQKLPQECLGYIFEFAVSSESAKDAAEAGVTLSFGLSWVNHYFRSVAHSTPSLWSTVSNMQTTTVLRLCIERSKAHHLCIVLLLGEADQFSDFLKTLTPHAPRW